VKTRYASCANGVTRRSYISFETCIGQRYLSDLENGRRKGTTAALKKIANVLNVPLNLLV